MGVMNITPDSFSDGGNFLDHQEVLLDRLTSGKQMVEDGARILDIGGESSRPGAEPVGHDEEMRRVILAIEVLVSSTY